MPLIVLQIDQDLPGMDVICAQRRISAFPTTQIWRDGVCEEVAAAELERRLLSYGVASQAKRFDSIGGTATFETDLGTGLPSATAVDEIDFTGGVPRSLSPVTCAARAVLRARRAARAPCCSRAFLNTSRDDRLRRAGTRHKRKWQAWPGQERPHHA